MTSEPVLPRFKWMPRRYDEGSLPHHRFQDPKSYFRQQYFEAMDIACGELERRSLQRRGMPVTTALESILIKDVMEMEVWRTYWVRSIVFQGNQYSTAKHSAADAPWPAENLQIENPSTPIKSVTSVRTLCDVICDLCSSRSLLNEVSNLLKIVLNIPISSATAERTFSCLRCLKTFLHSPMMQTRLHHIMP